MYVTWPYYTSTRHSLTLCVQAWAISTGTVMVNGNVVDGSYVIENGE